MERRPTDDRLVFDVIIRKRQVLVGYAPEWSRTRVQNLLNNVLVPRALLREPWWEEVDGTAAPAGAIPAGPATFAEVASEYVNRLESQYAKASTRNTYISPVMKHVGPFFADDGEGLRTLAEINGTLVSAFTKRKMHERELLADLADTLAELDDDTLRRRRRSALSWTATLNGPCSSATGSAQVAWRWRKR